MRRRLSLLALVAAAACTRPLPTVVPVPLDPPPSPAVAPKPEVAAKPTKPAPTPEPPAPVPATTSLAADIDQLHQKHLIIPVAGAGPEKLYDSFDEGRDTNRQHNAIDILAPRGTPILSADDGRILRMSNSELGGISMYTADPAGRFVYYYAHMDHYARADSVGRLLMKGDTLGFVGTTGNAPKDTPHLHFQIMRWPADGKYTMGEPINPYPILKAEALARARGKGPIENW